MKKVKSIKHEKIWGYEIWMYSSVEKMETFFEDGTPVPHGPLVKIIKANQSLSLQVHPDDKFAQELENQPNGKTESWYVIEALPGSELITGLTTYDENEIRERLKNKTFSNILLRTKIQKGEFYNIPAGRVHAVGAGATVFEVQQPSDTTYRYYDYDRKENGKLRELHIDKAIKVQKPHENELFPISLNPLTYENEICTQVFTSGKTILAFDSIVVDLELYEAYYCLKGEEVNFSNYAIVSMLKK